MKQIKAALHIHSTRSDGIFLPSTIVGFAKIAGIGVLSITDHNEIRGTLSAKKIAERLGLIYFPGIEVTFTVKKKPYELLAYFYNESDIKSFFSNFRMGSGFIPSFGSVDVVIGLIKKYHGVVVAPHPFGRKGIFRKGRNGHIVPDGIEVLNAFTNEKRNIKAFRHNIKHSFLEIGAADMHFFISDIRKTYTELTGEVLTRNEIWKNLKGEKSTINFKAVSESFSPLKSGFQKPLCGLIYAARYPLNYFSYFSRKND